MDALNTGGSAKIESISCPSAGDCAAGGYYADSTGHWQAVVAVEKNGVWGTPQQLPGGAAGGEVTSVSCASAGNCSVGGDVSNQAFVADEVNGSWSSPQLVSGLDSLNRGSIVTTVSCNSAGNCSAIGTNAGYPAFVVNEVNGVWQNAQTVPGLTLLDPGGGGAFTALSCAPAPAPPGNCAAGGSYFDQSNAEQVYVVDETNGIWGNAEQVPGNAAFDTAGDSAFVESLSCPSAGNCAAGGESDFNGFVADEKNGVWGNAEHLPATGNVTSLSCASDGNCAAGGTYDQSATWQAFVADEVNGAWGSPQEVTGLTALNTGNDAQVESLSCGSVGNCAAGGIYTTQDQSFQNPYNYQHVFLVNEVNGVWGTADTVPGAAALTTQGYGTNDPLYEGFDHGISCSAAGACVAAGCCMYAPAGYQPFLVHEPVVATTTTLTLSPSTVFYGGQISVAVSAAAGTPTGTVTVTATGAGGTSTTLCANIALAAGTGSCALAAGQLPDGVYQVTASYGGDANFGASASPAQALTVKPDTVTVTPPTAQNVIAGGPAAIQVHASDAAGLTLTYTASGLPPGVSIDSGTGLITGWPDTPGSYQPTVTARDSPQGSGSGSASFTWTVTPAPDQGPAGLVRLRAGGKCLSDVGNRSRNGNPVDVRTCRSRNKAQRWTWAQDQTVRIHGKCLTAPTSAGPVRLEPCDGQTSRQWEIADPNGSGSSAPALSNPASGLCLAVTSTRPRNGARVVARACDELANQVWTPPAGPITAQVTGMCVDDRHGKTYSGNKIVAWACNGSAEQQWQVAPDGSLRFRNKCLSVTRDGRAADSGIVLSRCGHSGPNQEWQALPDGGGVQLRNYVSGLCLTDPGDTTRNGTQLVIDYCNAAPPGNTWRLR